MQIGFDFGNEHQTTTVLQRWSDPMFTISEYKSYFSTALSNLSEYEGEIANSFRTLILYCADKLENQNRRMNYSSHKIFNLWDKRLSFPASQITALINEIENHSNTSEKTVTKIRKNRDYKAWGIYIDGIGSLTFYKFPNSESDYSCVDYVPWKSSFFNISFRDDMTWLNVPAFIWSDSYCAHKIADAYDKPAPVDVFQYEGREYVNTGGMSKGDYRECTAWTFVPRKYWNKEVFTYSQLRDEWDVGRIERGNDIGLLIRVRGVECVVNGAVMFFDENCKQAPPKKSRKENVVGQGTVTLL